MKHGRKISSLDKACDRDRVEETTKHSRPLGPAEKPDRLNTAVRPFLQRKEENMSIKRFHATFAKLPTGEVVIVLSVTAGKRHMTTGTRRPNSGKFPSSPRYKTLRVFVDGTVFQHGVVRSDWTDRLNEEEPYWYDPWEYNKDARAWKSFDTYYEDWDWEDKDARVYPIAANPWREDTQVVTSAG